MIHEAFVEGFAHGLAAGFSVFGLQRPVLRHDPSSPHGFAAHTTIPFHLYG
ncbi:hypothetical protein ACFYSJ_34480 [Streptomyces sp. NPDC005248]|uniref:hypothetical protein n=1 Tax=Streptomyces sp. NPDC005248 TaxID=3364709 RepID=UPI003690BA45